ncbi:Imm26 family immunity protein [Streptomyces sp. enrichment culture]|uniref:Imm26 family immunity protein n=1 Tax=Streptomyces sp. enrichment culture TaxID=1795815 RepID=UPI003F55505E
MKGQRRRHEVGDVYVLQVADASYRFGRIVKVGESGSRGRFPGGILAYIYDVASDDLQCDLATLTVDRLLMPPFFTVNWPWQKGYFRTVAHEDLEPAHVLRQHCFYDASTEGYVNENDDILRERVGRRALTSPTAWNWQTGERLLALDDPEEWDAAFERGERSLGTAAIGLAFNCTLEEASPRIIRAMQLPDVAQRGFAFTAAGTAARRNGALTPELYAALRAEGPGRRSIAVNAIDDTLTFVPFRRLPTWLKWWSVVSTVRNKLDAWRLSFSYAVTDAWKAVRRR